MITRKEAEKLLFTHLKSENLRKHCLATAAVMEKLAEKFDYDQEVWFITGLLHDIDFEVIGNDFSQHGLMAMELLQNTDITSEMKNAIKSHTEQAPITTDLDKSLWIADPVNGLIVAAALMRPDKKISTIELKSLKKKYKNRAFAAGANREQIADCIKLGLELDEFLQLAVDAMTKYEKELGFE
ncbi:MAG: HDIG domain-containing protein [Candidatus Cloacimonetes bacterium]|nr:HDIG domain-containing protein [Candidatus Cloacimonadota bacterium]